MKSIFHISDIHIDVGRYENLWNSFNILIKDIETQGVDESLLVIVGDIFENKTILTTDEINIFNDMMSLLNTHKIKTLLVVGNHDFNFNKADAPYRNNLSLEILTKSYNNITCLTNTQIYKIQNIEFHVYSIVDNKIPLYAKNNNIKIALLHDGVNGAKYDNGQIIEGERFSISDFDKYDYTMLGDIHKPQYLSDTTAYCGSFIQKNKGEGVNHGYMLWNLASQKSKHVYIPLKNLTIKLQATRNKCTFPKITSNQKITYVQLWHKGCKSSYIEELITKIKSIYGRIDKIVNKDLYTVAAEKTIEPVDNNKPTFNKINHDECIRELLKGQTPEDIAKVIVYHKEQLQHAKDINHVNYKINYLSWGNILCYGENNYIDFTGIDKDIVILNGKNKCGKSSVIDILIRILFNECERGYKKDIVNKNKKTGHIKISISVPDGTVLKNGVRVMSHDEYTIEQLMNKTGVSTIHRLYKNGVNITMKDINATYIHLNEVVGLGSYKDFINMTTALQNRKFLVDMKENDMLELLVKLLNIDMLENINKVSKHNQKLLQRDIKILNVDINQLKNGEPDPKLAETRSKKCKDLELELVKIKNSLVEEHRKINKLSLEIDNSSSANIDNLKSKIINLKAILGEFVPDKINHTEILHSCEIQHAITVTEMKNIECDESDSDDCTTILTEEGYKTTTILTEEGYKTTII
jgi:DNA repair exonuclease SbcCD nuclease subunit